jgi:hypothetical protein
MVFTVDKFTKVEAGATLALLKAGTVIVADGNLEQPISLQDGPLEKSIRDAFRLVYAVHKPNDITDDDVFGAKEPKCLGQKWSMNRSLAVRGFKDNGITVPEDQLSGTVSLEALG